MLFLRQIVDTNRNRFRKKRREHKEKNKKQEMGKEKEEQQVRCTWLLFQSERCILRNEKRRLHSKFMFQQ